MADPQLEMLELQLGVRRSLLSANIHTPAVDTATTLLPRAAHPFPYINGRGK